MKKHILKVTCLMLASCFIFTSCNNEDETPPFITILGNAVVDHILNSDYIDAGATASDDEDGDITALIVTTNNVDKDMSGIYTVTYDVSDAAGNVATQAVRTVNVFNESNIYDGTYSVTIQCPGSSPYTYTEDLAASSLTNNRVVFQKFGDYSVPSGTKVYGDVNLIAGTVTIPSQTLPDAGTPPYNTDRTFAGTGTVSQAGGTTTMVLTVTESTTASTVQCTHTYTL